MERDFEHNECPVNVMASGNHFARHLGNPIQAVALAGIRISAARSMGRPPSASLVESAKDGSQSPEFVLRPSLGLES